MFRGLVQWCEGRCKKKTGIFLSLALISVVSTVAFFATAQSSPGLSGVGATLISDNGAQIVWTTDIPGSSRVYFNSTNDGTYPNYNNGRCDAGGLITSHCAILSGLYPNTTYYYQVESIDASNTPMTSSGYSFSTTGNQLSDVNSSSVYSTTAQVRWTSTNPSDSHVVYGTATGSYNTTSTGRCDGGGMVTSHCAILSTLVPSTTYFYKVQSTDSRGNTAFLDGFQLTTLAAETIPAAPTGLNAFLNSSGLINITWVDNSSNETRFEVQMRSGTTTGFTTLGNTGANSTTYIETSHPAGTYYYQVRACNGAGCSAFAGPAYVVVGGAIPTSGGTGDTVAPTVPTGLNVSTLTSSNVTLRWTASSDSGSGIAGYIIKRNGGTLPLTATTTGTGVTFNDTSVIPGYGYYYQVAAYDAAGNISAFSSSLFLNIPTSVSGTCSNFSLLLASGKTSYTQGDILTYTYACASGYAAYVEMQLVKPGGTVVTYNSASGSLTSRTLGFGTSNLDPGNYTLRACFSAGTSCTNIAGTAPFSVSSASGGSGSSADTTSPTPPTWVTTTPVSSSQINLAWGGMTDNVAVTGYKLYKNSSLVYTGNNSTYVSTGLAPATSYSYQISTYDSAGNSSGLSPAVSTSTFAIIATSTASVDTIAPVMPTSISATAYSSSRIELSWNAATDNVGVAGYKIYRGDDLLNTQTGGMLTYSDTGLVSATSYRYKVLAFDAAGNVSSFVSVSVATNPSSIYTPDTTSIGPNISAPQIVMSAPFVVMSKWTTDIPSNGRVDYGTVSGAYTKSSDNTSCQSATGTYVTAHCVVLPELVAGKQYYYKIFSANPAGISRPSSEFVFTVPVYSVNNPVRTSTTTAATLATSTKIVTVASPEIEKQKVAFNVALGEKFCSGDQTLAPITFSVQPEIGGYFSVPGVVSGTVTFTNKVVNIPNGTYSWSATLKSGYEASTPTQGTLSISKLEKCVPPAPAVSLNEKTTGAESKSVTASDNGAIPQPISVQTYATYNDSANALAQKVEEIPVTLPIAEKIQAIQDARETMVPSPQSETVQLGTATLSRKDSPNAVVDAVSSMMDQRVSSPTFVDSDKDGISDYDEIRIYGTDPKNPDTNGDGIQDGASILAGIDPAKKKVTAVTYEDPKQVSVALLATSTVLTVNKVEGVMGTAATGTAATVKALTFEGKGMPNSYVTLYLFSTPVVVTIKTDGSGNWRYTIDKELGNGSHEAYVALTGGDGKILAKSSPIPFVKTAAAASITTPAEAFGRIVDNGAQERSFWQGNAMFVTMAIVILMLLGSVIALGSALRRKE